MADPIDTVKDYKDGKDAARSSFVSIDAWRLAVSQDNQQLNDYVLRHRDNIVAALDAAVTLFTNNGWGTAKASLQGGAAAGVTAENAFLTFLDFTPTEAGEGGGG